MGEGNGTPLQYSCLENPTQESRSHSKDQNAGLLPQTEENQNGEIRREKERKEKGNTEGIKVK